MEIETDRDRHRQTDIDRDRQRQTETDRDRQRQTETDRDNTNACGCMSYAQITSGSSRVATAPQGSSLSSVLQQNAYVFL